jgi:hypothetical protein
MLVQYLSSGISLKTRAAADSTAVGSHQVAVTNYFYRPADTANFGPGMTPFIRQRRPDNRQSPEDLPSVYSISGHIIFMLLYDYAAASSSVGCSTCCQYRRVAD